MEAIVIEHFGIIAEAFQRIIVFVESISGTITALATLALAALTWVLARATNAMARATSSANVVASLEVNQWSFRHLDLVVQNTGNAPAFETIVEFTPPLPFMTNAEKNEVPFGKISILRPGQMLKSSVNDWQSVSQNIYRVKIQWKRTPSSKRWECNAYDFDLAALGKVSRLGAGSPEVQIAEQIKKMREDWQSVARGQKQLKVETYDHSDRERERAEIEEFYREARKDQKKDLDGDGRDVSE
jgi:hypothetical protein